MTVDGRQSPGVSQSSVDRQSSADSRNLRLSQRLQAAAIAAVATPLISLLCRTWTVTVEGAEHYDAVVATRRQPILAFWHGRILPSLYYFRDRRIVVITSQNFDGEWIARIITRFGYGTARGSSSRGGARALVQMRRDLADDKPVAFTVDGPRGPARVAQSGAAFLAGATGHPVIPFHIEANRSWTTTSWDRAQIPKPFARVHVVIGEPIAVHGTSDEEVEVARQQIERALADLEARARRSGAGRAVPASDGDGGAGGAKPPGKE
ncbi:MAG TPA: lysophospholipid acyltransferase family protein [Vicinamibacterales bacterium]|nr:lysophospholipid acyltransferase family protein [Vicinamibacterales bacterium]